MTSALVEIFAEAWDTLFNKHPRIGSALKIVLICIVACFLYYGIQTQTEHVLENNKQQDSNFETIADQNRQLLNILEAQNALFSDRIETLEQRQYELQKDIVALIKESQHYQRLAQSPAPTATAQPTVSLPVVSLPSNTNVEVRSAEIVESINVLKSQMTSESENVQSSDDEQTQQPAGH